MEGSDDGVISHESMEDSDDGYESGGEVNTLYTISEKKWDTKEEKVSP